MSRRHRSTPLAITAALSPRSWSLRLLAAALLYSALVAFTAGMLATRVMADPPAGVTFYSADEAHSAGVAIEFRTVAVGDEELIELEAPNENLLLDVAGDGSLIAVVADGIGPESGALSVRQPDGSVLRAELHGLLDAAFAPDASWLAVLDGHGALIRFDPSTGTADLLADGPFTGPVRFMSDGRLLLRSVSSVHAPFISELTRLDPASGEAMTLSGDELVYAGLELDDGSIVYVAHARGEGTVVMRAGPRGAERIADLGVAATDVDISGSGAIAFAVPDDGVYLIDPAASAPRRVGPGAAPRFSPDGEELLVIEHDGARVIGLDGLTLARLGSPAAAWGCGEGCDR
jgi:hypothetical protein